MSRNYDLDGRLIKFACKIIDIVERLPANRAGNYFAGQLIRAGNSPAKKMIQPGQIAEEQLKEVEELIAIVATSIETAEKNKAKEEKSKHSKLIQSQDQQTKSPPET
jgi:hypothetical protein